MAKKLNAKETNKKKPGAWLVPIYNGKALALKRTDGLWDFPGGSIDKGESSLEAAIRELKEEANITVELSKIKPIGVNIVDGRYLNLFCVLIGGEQANTLKLKEDEHTSFLWIKSVSEIKGELNPPTKTFKQQGWLRNLDFILSKL